MVGPIFGQAIRHHWRGALAWGLGLGLLNLVTITFVPNMDVLRQYEELFTTLPSGLLQAFGIDGSQMTPDSFVASLLFSRLILFASIFGVNAGMNVTANEEDAGIMHVLLSQPVSRARVMGERLLAHFALTWLLVIPTYAGLLIGVQFVELEFNLGRQFEVVLSLYPTLLVVIAATVLFGVLLRRRTMALAASGAFVIGSFFLETLGAAISEGVMPLLRRLSFMAYNPPADIVTNGTQWGEFALLLLLTGLLTAGALYVWQQRDVGV